METNYNPYTMPSNGAKQDLPNATATLVLGILSIVFCWCCYVPSIVMAIIALVFGSKGKSLYRLSPDQYTESSYKNLNAGHICAIIGLVLTVLLMILATVNAIVNPESSRHYEEMLRNL